MELLNQQFDALRQRRFLDEVGNVCIITEVVRLTIVLVRYVDQSENVERDAKTGHRSVPNRGKSSTDEIIIDQNSCSAIVYPV